MAGGGEALGGGGKQRRGKGGKRKAKKRVGFRLDMTPLVDITFLLLTFFMLTTSMITPQTMEMNVPPQQEIDVPVKESELLTIIIRNDGKLFVKVTGKDEARLVRLSELRTVVVEQNIALRNRCIVSLKSDPNVAYGSVVRVLDMLNQAESAIIQGLRQNGVNERRRIFTVAPFTDKDREEVAGL
ncbi:MAG TPA: hypothetical protein DIS79_09745 [Bacteroidetes bacterium]|nr:hypothetical protein [Bacteroidota bacterium]HRK04217.1 biopolymer transporter ExbD [Chlorobiota bacterium]